MRENHLNAFAIATVAASGIATASLGPTGVETWHITRIAVKVSTNVLEPIAQVYLGSVADGNLVGGTYTGSLDSSDEDLWLPQSTDLFCVWSGADVGARATLSVFGVRTS